MLEEGFEKFKETKVKGEGRGMLTEGSGGRGMLTEGSGGRGMLTGVVEGEGC